MNKIIEYVGIAAALVGTLVCLVAGLVRFSGEYFVGGDYAAMTLFNVGVGLMVFAVLVRVHLPGADR